MYQWNNSIKEEHIRDTAIILQNNIVHTMPFRALYNYHLVLKPINFDKQISD